ncbi:MAG: hypothetical protein Q4C60_09525 [Eubacteriales bacterium]|nr:hypothetical protein [Eubacteriales bacterium]
MDCRNHLHSNYAGRGQRQQNIPYLRGGDGDRVHGVYAVHQNRSVNNEIRSRREEKIRTMEKEEKKTEFSLEPIVHKCFTEDFAKSTWLLRSFIQLMDCSQPFRMEISYDPEQLRVETKVFMSKEAISQYSRKAQELSSLPALSDSSKSVDQNEEKRKWLSEIGAKEWPEAVKYIYSFPGYDGAFNLSERYVNETPLEELKAQYEENKTYCRGVISNGKTEIASKKDIEEERKAFEQEIEKYLEREKQSGCTRLLE